MSCRVLVVDDHVRFRMAAVRVLVADGFEVAGEAGTASQALVVAEALAPDLVLLDVGLPDGSGLDVAAELRSLVPDAAVVLTSTRDAGDYAARAVAAGARGFIPKDELTGAALRDLLGAPHGRRPGG